MSSICVSVIVPVFNASATMGVVLKALTLQDCFQPFEIIVVDDGSFDNTPQVVAQFPSVKYIRQDNAGPAAARNRGAKMACGEYLAFTDSDCIAHKDWLSLLMAGMGQAQVGAVAGSYGIANPESWLADCIYKEITWRHAHLMPDFPKSFGSYNFCVRKNVFDAVGGFNTGYRRASGEDNDLSYKIIQSGWRIYFKRQAFVDHYHPVRVMKYLKEQYQHGFWRVRMYKDHPRMMRGDGYTFWKDMVEMPLCAVLLLGMLFWIPACAGMTGRGAAMTRLMIGGMTGFLVFEILWALVMTKNFFEGILFGFIFIFRAFARFWGLSTGIFSFLFRK